MSEATTSIAQAPGTWTLPYRGKVGMACLIIAESAIFTIFVIAYLFYAGKSMAGPTPREVLETPIFFHDLPVVQQPDDSFRGTVSGAGRTRGIPWFLVPDDFPGRSISVWHRTGMAPPDL